MSVTPFHATLTIVSGVSGTDVNKALDISQDELIIGRIEPAWTSSPSSRVATLGWIALPEPPLSSYPPVVEGLRITGGRQFSPEFMALLLGLAIYTSAFIADVVRAGIQSAGKGQVEAARSLGLNGFQVLRLVVLPQALRVIVPPLTSQYLNLTPRPSGTCGCSAGPSSPRRRPSGPS